MTRARATALVLVNWKGVFYERYLLDRHVTSLEGANGAGKTTVMIAAYVVLLPDMSRLRFTNLGESGATGGDRGIWGRLGELGRPSYAALELDLAGERLVIGVQLERKAEPTVTPVAFRIDGLEEHVRLQDLFLVKHELDEAVPDLKELTANVEKLGARIEVFKSIREYFEELFERGISPLRLAHEDERGKLNEMLRTSMTGGISRALTSELRTFLFREETGLSDALSRMRANLDTCRRSRTEVLEAQRLERELNGVFDAGQSLLRLALLAAKKQVLELTEGMRSAAAERDRAADRARAGELALAAATERERALRGTIERAREERAAAAEALGRALLAHECSLRIAGFERDREKLSAALEAARAVRDGASANRERARKLRHAAQDGLARAAAGLAQLERGLEELARRAHEHRAVVERLALARELLDGDVDAERAREHADGLRARVRELDAESARLARRIETAAVRRAEFERAFAALRELAPDATREAAFERASAELGKAVDLEIAARAAAELEREHTELSRHAVRRRALTEQAAALGITLPEQGMIAALNEAWSEAERALSDAELALRRREESLREARQNERTLDERRRAVEARVARHRELNERLARLGARLGEQLDLEGAQRVRERLARDRDSARERAVALRLERERALELAARLEAARGAVSPELLRLSDELDAELCATRFDDLDAEAAAEMEARLGPLADALVVLDPLAASAQLPGAREIPEVILVSPDALRAELEGSELREGSNGDLVIAREGLVRVVRKPQNPRLGRRARAVRAQELRERADAIAGELEQLQTSQGELEGLSRELERVVADGGVAGADPSAELGRLEAELASARLEIERSRDAIGRAQDAERLARERVLALRSLVAQSSSLGERSGERSLDDVAARLERARAARAELERRAPVERVLRASLEALRSLPPTEAELELASANKARLELERDRLFRAGAALEYVADHRPAFAFDEAERALTSEAAIAPSLQAEHERSRAALLEAERELEAAEGDWDAATRAFQAAEAEHLAVLAVLAREREELARLAEPGSSLETETHRERLRELDERLASLAGQEREKTREVALLSERLERDRATLSALEREVEQCAARLGPVEARLLELGARFEAEGAACPDAAEEPRPSSELWVATRGKRELLLERLERARGGSEPARAVRELLAPAASAELDTLRVELEAWSIVREWLVRCLPNRITHTHDAMLAVASLRQHLALLEERLERQETELRGASEDVARGIDVQIRRAQGQVRRLNQHLMGVQFGSIRGIRIRMGRVERMDQILRALREGATQELLFQPDLPIEEALNEIFRRHGGGKNGAQRLLDYREYLDLGVEVTREVGGTFEPANPTRLSTGEAIGVGAALMMVVLTEWERDANLLRGKRPLGSLRFLFLDEANRLSQDNLGVLFDLCQALDLQLLIAAPEVARAEGNTTYRLVRTRAENGVEEVKVSGRRGIAVRGAEPISAQESGEGTSI